MSTYTADALHVVTIDDVRRRLGMWQGMGLGVGGALSARVGALAEPLRRSLLAHPRPKAR